MARELGISSRITFTGAVTEEEKGNWYRRATLCVIPSTYDPSPIVAFEALAAGKPVVATNVGGLPEVIHNKINGLLVTPRNPKEIAEAVEKILSDKKLASKLSKNALQTIEREYTWEHAARKTLNAYRTCIGEA
jgi:glycosyltransferase involved in cell wall biosynthesis